MKPASGNWQLKPLNSPDLPSLIDVPSEGLTLGRDGSNAVVFSQHRYPHVSSFHARVSLVDDVPVVEDLGSSNGSLVNGRETPEATLKAGDVLQLGRGVGPRLLVIEPNNTADMAVTVNVPRWQARAMADSFGATTIMHLKAALGLPQGDVQLKTVLRKRSRRQVVLFVLLFVLLVGGFGAGAYYLKTVRQEDLAQVKELNRQLRERLDRSGDELRARLERSQQELSAHRRVWEEQKLRLEEERTSLQTRIVSLESEGRVASGEIDRFRERLHDTNTKLAKYKPVDLSQEAKARQEILQRSLAAVVYIEKRVSFQDQKSGALLYGTETPVGWLDINLEGKGEPYYEEGGGSGFCISPEGYIVTNAHVVEPMADEGRVSLKVLGLEARVQLTAVFTGRSEKTPLEVVKVAGPDVDLALVRMKPFDGMPYLPGLEGDPAEFRLVSPMPGNEVLLFGFPFGKYIPQEGDKLSASVFAGIISRNVGKYVQVHAAIYPGNSGGPVVDPEGRLVGVVTSVQTMPSGQIASDIGFVVPAEKLRAIWPHDAQDDAGAGDH